MILNSKVLNYIRTQARLGDEAEDEEGRAGKYRIALCMLVHGWRVAWPDCVLKTSILKKNDDQAYEVEVYVALSPYGYPGGRIDRFRATLRFADSDDLVIDFCRVAQGVTDQFYDWQQHMLRSSLQRSLTDEDLGSAQSSPKPKNAQ